MLGRFGHDPRPTAHPVHPGRDETVSSHNLAPLLGFYAAQRLRPPVRFLGSWNGVHRDFEQVMKTAWLYNTAGLNDDARAFASIPARHNLQRRAALVVRRMVAAADAHGMTRALAYDLARDGYRLDSPNDGAEGGTGA